ncbi:unnamed protein product [marine sediment metagenome]|uniref:Uncharacterized protein n=1 Tax=marine sediment metagenome TaxID=412755 RepID=X0ZDH5_9ZZZZ
MIKLAGFKLTKKLAVIINNQKSRIPKIKNSSVRVTFLEPFILYK